MNILVFTNTFAPHVGGVARSVTAFAAEYRRRGHRVMIVAPEFPGMPQHEIDVVRVAAIQHFNASDFSVALPVHPALNSTIDEFQPHIVHSQHPFLLGMAALRIARRRELPLVFTHHTRYERYTHYVPGDSPAMKRFAIELATRYANLADQVFAPSESIRDLLRRRGVTAPVSVVPTGVCLEQFAHGNGAALRTHMQIPASAFVVGHVGRLAPEKNLEFLARAVAAFVAGQPRAHFLVVGSGPSEANLRAVFERAGLAARLHVAGILQGQALADALHAMDVFAFASLSETQGMVLTEAMAAGLPVVAIDAPGAREVVRHGYNGCLLRDAAPAAFSAALQAMATLDATALRATRQAARATAEGFSMPRMAERALACYEQLIARNATASGRDDNAWEDLLTAIRTEWQILKSMASAGDAALAAGGPAAEPMAQAIRDA